MYAFLKEHAGEMSFSPGGKSFDSLTYETLRSDTEDGFELTRRFEGGLEVCSRCRLIDEFGAVEWVNYLTNRSDHLSDLISGVCDCDIFLPFRHDENRRATAYMPREEDAVVMVSPSGSTWAEREFYDEPYRVQGDRLAGLLFPGDERLITASGGRSCEAKAPFFNFRKGDMGCIVAVGWSGQWFMKARRSNDALRVQTGIESLSFRLQPGECVRLSSIVIMSYGGDFLDGQNKWRRLVCEKYSLIGQPGRDAHAPYCAGFWGGMSTNGVLDRLSALNASNIPCEYIWMDAGWYGSGTKPSPDEFEGDWAVHTGCWQVNENYHPDGLIEVTKSVHAGGRRFLLWFEPERVRAETPIAREHPEYFLKLEGRKDLLLNLGDGKAWKYCLETLSERIRTLGIDFLRIDFNISPLPYWDAFDAPERLGMTQIRYIGGLYKLWDELLRRHPSLMIDSCSSGGRRIDIETLRRSVPLWRSDAMCPANFAPETAQCHALTFPLWLPYSGTGVGRVWPDTYRFRSCFAPALTTNFTFSERDAFGDDPEKLEWFRLRSEEYLRARPYLCCDFYPLTEFSTAGDCWTALEYHDPVRDEGVVLAFRRPLSPFPTAEFTLRGLLHGAVYVFEDADSGEEFERNDGTVTITLPQRRSSKLLFFRRKQ